MSRTRRSSTLRASRLPTAYRVAPPRPRRVSKRHFTARWDEELRAFLLIDNDSKNGVTANGRRVTASRRRAHGDRIRVAQYEVTFAAD
jgi:pSer/pThr/pTyr-binding forkhead associated (FHA) protein